MRQERVAPTRPRRERAAVIAAVAAVLLVTAGVGVGIRLAAQPAPSGAERALPIGPAPTHRRLDRLAEAAPCRLASRDRHPATATQLARFIPVAAVECSPGLRTFPGKGQWQVSIRRVATAGLRPLSAALLRPSQHRSSSTVCAAVGYGPLPVLLVDAAGRYEHPQAPTDTCGAPLPAVMRALHDLHWRTVEVAPVSQARTPASLASGCAMDWKNELYFDSAAPGPTHRAAPVFSQPANGRLRVCLYRTGTDLSVGGFERALTLTGPPARKLLSALAGPAPGATTSCSPQRDFATIWSGGQWVNAEFGGCWRVQHAVTGPTWIGTAHPREVRQLLGI